MTNAKSKTKITHQVTFMAISAYLPEDHSESWSLHLYLKQFYDQFSGHTKITPPDERGGNR